MPQIANQRGGFRINLGLKSQRISLEKHRAFAVADFVFVQIACADTGYEQFPHPGFMPRQWMTATVPLVKSADYADPAGVRRPQGEIDPGDALFYAGMRPQFGEQISQCSLLQGLAIGRAE